MELKYRVDTNFSPRTKLMGRMKLGVFFALPEKEFSEYIKQIEGEKIFQELLSKYRIVKYRKFPGIRQSPSSLEFKEEITPADNFDLTDFIQKAPQSWQIVRKVATKIGEEKFSHFLKGDDSVSFDKISRECNLSLKEAEKFKDFINSFQLQESFFASDSSTISFPKPHLHRVAYIENREGEFFILPLNDSTYLIKGRYVINYKRWENLIQEEQISPDKINKISKLFRKLDMINRRTTTLYQTIYQIKEKQRQFLLSGDSKDIVPFTQQNIAQTLKVNPSTISRAIANKSLITPWGKEKALKEFFPGKKEKIKTFLLEIIREEGEKLKEGILPHPLSDEEIGKNLKKAFKANIARRTVTKYRKELKIPSSRKREALYKPDEELTTEDTERAKELMR